MANATVSEYCSLDDLDEIEFPDIDSYFVMSLLEESQVVEGADDERLRNMIQSLEAEISNHEDCFEEVNYQLFDCSTSPDHCVYFEGFDEEMMPYGIIDFADEIENVVEFVGLVGDYSEICHGMALEEDEYQGLWQ